MPKQLMNEALDFLMTNENNPDLDTLKTHISDVVNILIDGGYRSIVLSHMYGQLASTCRKLGFDDKDVYNLQGLAARLDPGYVNIDDKPDSSDERVNGSLIGIRPVLKRATPRQREYFRNLMKQTPEKLRGSLLEKLGAVGCDYTLRAILYDAASALKSVPEDQRSIATELLIQVPCNVTLRGVLTYIKSKSCEQDKLDRLFGAVDQLVAEPKKALKYLLTEDN